MVRVALTGGLATGKSHVIRALAARGIPTIDADVLAREALAPGSAGVEAVVRRFGDAVRAPGGAIDRRALARVVFGDAEARRDLEAIVHPYVYARIADWFRTVESPAGFAVADIPLLFETGRERDFDRVVVVACAPERQVERAMARDGLAEADVRARLAAQWPIGEKVAKADHVILTDGTFAETDAQIDRVVEALGEEARRGRQ
ncbi:MAG TPA: dephospho-CoA kinase [Vicinamibacterales bacterium]